MNKVWIFFVLIGSTYVLADSALRGNKDVEVEELEKAYDEDWYPDELGINENGLDNKNDESEELAEGESIETGDYYEELDEAVNLPSIEQETSKNLEEEVSNLNSKESAKKSEDNNNGGEVFDANVDYQIEDNRSELKYDQKDGSAVLESKEDNNSAKKDVSSQIIDHEINADSEDFNDLENPVADDDGTHEILYKKESSLEKQQVPNNEQPKNQDSDEESALLDETKDILSEDNDDNDFNDLEAEASQQVEMRADLADETKSILADPDTFTDDETKESSNQINEELKGNSKDEKVVVLEPSVDRNDDPDEDDEDDENVEKIYADLQSDIDKLVDTWKKLQVSDEDTKEDSEPVEHDDILEYEEKYGRPFKEGIVLQQREDYDTFYDDNLSELFGDDNNASKENVNDNINNTENKNHDDDYEQVNDSNLSQIFKEFDEQSSRENPPSLANDMLEENEKGEDSDEESEKTDEVGEIAEEDNKKSDAGSEKIDRESEKVDKESEKTDKDPFSASENNDDQNKDKKIKLTKEIHYGDDALIDEYDKSSQKEIAEEQKKSSTAQNKQVNVYHVKEMNVNDLSADQLEEFMKQFDVVHNNDILATDCDGNVGVIRKTLTVDKPLIISSCGFPNRYPTNKVMDWVLDGAGNGMGIELNFTDLDLNGALGDYVLIKPGQADSSGRDGLVFSFHLNSERKYRFLDVNRIFIRFEANLGMAFRTGFQLSVKLVEPLREIQPEQAPEPEALIPPPSATMTVNLGGVTLQDFLAIEEEFRRLVADMATMYINANNMDPGLNTTFETTQIVSRSICNIRWPNFENCAEVKFGIPLMSNNEEEEEESRLNKEDLSTMWSTYIDIDPFAARLRRMGVVEFAVPNDSSVLTVWVVIAVGVVISVAMLAFALWRFSCFEDYTRMAAYSDSDSLSNEKRGLDLYPTPHQTLPPLYSDADYKWADNTLDDSTRVDMGGFANKSYVQEDLFNLDSDEEIIATRERSDKHLSV